MSAAVGIGPRFDGGPSARVDAESVIATRQSVTTNFRPAAATHARTVDRQRE
jgi:hypothetical protein